MGVFGKAARYSLSACALWWREGDKALLNRIVLRLRERLGIDLMGARVQAAEHSVNSITSAVSTWAVTSWIEHAKLDKTPLVSVILPTRNRGTLLRRAVDSVRAQIYPHWEIVAVDDGSTDDTPAVIEQLRSNLGSERLRAIHIPNSGVCAARNRGLAVARGRFVAYLDDDNAMHPLWLKAIVWAFSQRPEIDVVYGGIVVDDYARINGQGAGDLPSYHLYPFDRSQLVRGNLADIGAIAHRSGLPEAHFDESLREMGDWDLLLRLTRQKVPLMVPVVACFYSTDAPGRLSGGPTFSADAAKVREKNPS